MTHVCVCWNYKSSQTFSLKIRFPSSWLSVIAQDQVRWLMWDDLTGKDCVEDTEGHLWSIQVTIEGWMYNLSRGAENVWCALSLKLVTYWQLQCIWSTWHVCFSLKLKICLIPPLMWKCLCLKEKINSLYIQLSIWMERYIL